jgi:hypothetical protein
MHRRFRTIILALALVAAFPMARGQEITDISVPPIPNAPFSGVIHVQRTILGQNGAVTNLKTTREIHRDHLGRTYDSRRPRVLAEQTTEAEVVRMLLYDPKTHIMTVLDAHSHTFRQRAADEPPATTNFVQASLVSDGNPHTDYTKGEDLGIHEIGGVPAHGVRSLKITPANASGTGKEVVISDEYWYSDDLHMFLMMKHDDPRSGSLTITMDEITRAEPDPALFEIPAGYKQKD